MDRMDRYYIERLQEFFLKAAAATYVSGKKAKINIDGEKVFEWGDGEFCYRDGYRVNGERSFGQTIIYLADTPSVLIWVMQYQGWCKNDDKEVLIHLKRALLTAYTAGQFIGGRGPALFEENWENGLVYENMLGEVVQFASFQGRERIYRKPHNNPHSFLFWHRYQGMLLDEAL